MSEAIVLTTLLFTSAALLLWLASICALRWEAPGLRGLVLLLCLTAAWCILDGFWQLLPTYDLLWFLKRTEYLCYTLLPVCWLFLLLDYKGDLGRRSYVLLAMALVMPILTVVLVWTNDYHHLVYQLFMPFTRDGLRLLNARRGPWFYFHFGYSAVFSAGCALTLLRFILPGSKHYLARLGMYLFAIALPAATALMFENNAGPIPGFDFTPFGMAACAVLLTFGLGQFRLFDMVPIVYDQLLRQLPDPVLVVDRDGRVLTSNPAAAALLGREISTPGRRLVNRVRLAESTETVDLSELPPPGTEIEIEHEGASRRFRVSVTPLRVRSIFELGRIFVLRETTQDRLAQRTLEESRQAAIEANRAKSEFLAVMSHELRTPLNAVIGSSSLLMDTPLDVAQREYAGMIRSSSQSLLRVINDILDLSKIEAGRMTLEHIDFDLRSAIEDCIEMVLPAALRKGLDVILDFAPQCGGMFQGDPARIRQILINFLSNAAKFTERGSIRVEVRKAPPAEGRAAADSVDILLAVEDTGVGIEPSSLPYIFESFRQADASTTRRFGGTGLGLAICRKLSELMGGEIDCTSVPGKGSRFWCRFPLQPSTARPAAAPCGLYGVVMQPGESRDRLADVLRELGAEVACVSAAEEIDPEVAAAFAVWIVDWTHPLFEHWGGTSGWCRAVRAQRLSARIAALARLQEADREAAREAGVIAFVDEPWLVSRLRAMLAAQQPLAPVPGSGGVVPAQARAPRILLAEDNAVNRRIATLMLADLEARLETALNGREAVTLVANAPYDLILMDLQMPEMGGIEATRAIRRIEAATSRIRVPICALTAGVLNNERDHCLEAGMDDFLAKPIMKAQLLEVCRRWLARRADGGPQQASAGGSS
jgi:signal transduction histidine kinase/CheY-like chemotaxis protein